MCIRDSLAKDPIYQSRLELGLVYRYVDTNGCNKYCDPAGNGRNY